MARLTDQERQEIIRFIEADKPLPDKYRFLLFEDKRDDRHQVQKAPTHRDVGDIHAPHLIGPGDRQSSKKIRIHSILRVRL